MSDRESRRQRYNDNRAQAMAEEAAAAAAAAAAAQQEPGALDPQMQMLATAFAQALGSLPALQQPPPAAPAPVAASHSVLQQLQLPNNAIKIP